MDKLMGNLWRRRKIFNSRRPEAREKPVIEVEDDFDVVLALEFGAIIALACEIQNGEITNLEHIKYVRDFRACCTTHGFTLEEVFFNLVKTKGEKYLLMMTSAYLNQTVTIRQVLQALPMILNEDAIDSFEEPEVWTSGFAIQVMKDGEDIGVSDYLKEYPCLELVAGMIIPIGYTSEEQVCILPIAS